MNSRRLKKAIRKLAENRPVSEKEQRAIVKSFRRAISSIAPKVIEAMNRIASQINSALKEFQEGIDERR